CAGLCGLRASLFFWLSPRVCLAKKRPLRQRPQSFKNASQSEGVHYADVTYRKMPQGEFMLAIVVAKKGCCSSACLCVLGGLSGERFGPVNLKHIIHGASPWEILLVLRIGMCSSSS